MKIMKKTKILIAALFLMGFGISAKAQVSASATAGVTIVTPIAITKTVDMNFGNVAVSASSGTVILDTDGNRSLTGGITLPTTAGTVTSASFAVTGAANYTYSITLPSTDVTLTKAGGGATMLANSFTSFPSTVGTLNASGEQTLKVGATLNVLGNQSAGQYISSGFNVTVNYN